MTESEGPCWLDLPDEVSLLIFSSLSDCDLSACGRTCRCWYRLFLDPLLWQRRLQSRYGQNHSNKPTDFHFTDLSSYMSTYRRLKMESERSDPDFVFQEVSARIKETQGLLASESDRVKAERDRLERDLPKLQQFQGKVIKLDVGGVVFKTSLETVKKDPDSMLASMFSGRFEMKSQEDGSFFIDRDPTHFRFILNYLRTGEVIVPQDPIDRKELMMEAEFFNIRPIMVELHDFTGGTLMHDFTGGTLMGEDNKRNLISWLNGKCHWRLIYKASRDGFKATDFHRCCDNKGETVSVIHTAGNYLFGGYTDVSWIGSGGVYQASSKSFLFAFRSHLQGNSPVKANIVNFTHAVYHASNHCCTFGGGHNIYIADSSNSNSSSYTNWGSGQWYSFPTGVTTSKPYWLVGQKTFQTVDVEVFGHL